jgi:hypothetical protein
MNNDPVDYPPLKAGGIIQNNEPAAWMFEKDGAYMCIKHDSKVNYDGGIPLYTHPTKTLTDDEIPVFARAILRKAQEK